MLQSNIKINNNNILKNDKKNKRKTTLNGKLKIKVKKNVEKVENKKFKLKVSEVKEFKLVLICVPNEWEYFNNINEKFIYIMMSEEFKDISIGDKHKLGDKLIGFNLDYPVYKLIHM